MSSQDAYPYSNKDSSRQGFAELYTFLRDAFQQRGLVSIPPDVLQLFKQCPLQDIECPDIAAFAKLFEGTRSSNRFRLEANSFIYTVQILFHLRPNLVQERVLHLLMLSVRLLKDETGAIQRLSELAGRKIDCYAVARKRATISNKLIPWLLKHFSQDSTIARLKIIAAQFLFHLLQGDEEAKTILSSCPDRERWSLGRSICASCHLPLRILAANILREISLADIDVRLFWSSDLLERNDPRLPSSFLADGQWLRDTIMCLRDLGDPRATPDESRGKTHEILSLRAGSLAFSDVASKMLVTVSERLLFIVPAHQNRPLQILEIPLIANMKYERSNGTVLGEDTLGGEAELRLHLRNIGFYILNGFKSAIDEVHLSFATHDHCDGFCQAMANSLQNIPTGPQTLAVGQSDVDAGGSGPRPKKQSRAVMINLSQGDVIGGDTQSLSNPLQTPHRVSTSLRMDMSGSTDSSKSPTSPLPEIAEEKAAPVQPEDDEEDGLPDSQHVQHDLIQDSKVGVKTNPHNTEKSEIVDNVRGKSEEKNLPGESVAPAYPECTSQDTVVAQTAGRHLPQQMPQHDLAETKIGYPVASSALQNLALDVLQYSVESLITTTASHTDPIVQSEEGNHRSTAAQFTDGSPRPPPPSALANSGKRMASKPDSSNQAASTTLKNPRKQNEGTEGKTSREILKRPRAASAVPAGGTAVDWDEDLRADQEEDKDQSKPSKNSKASACRGARAGPKNSAGTKTVPKPPAPRKKGLKKDKFKENKTQVASASASLANTRPRRATANVSYDEQSEQEGQSQGTVVEIKKTVRHAESDHNSVAAPSPSTKNPHAHRKTPSLDEQNVGDVSDSPLTEPQQPAIPPEAVVEVSGSSEALPAAAEPNTKPEINDVEKDASGPGRESSRGQKGREIKPSHEIPEHSKHPEVEAVGDSHPMDTRQRADAITTARKSFGSALLDVMNENGMQPIQTPRVETVRTKPFGDKKAFVNSVKSALKQVPRKPEAKAPSSGRRKHVQTPSASKQEGDSATRRRPPDNILQSARTSDRTPRNGSPSHQQIEGVGVSTLPQTADAAAPTAVSERREGPMEVLSSPDGRQSDVHQTQPRRDHAPHDNDIKATSSGSSPSIARPRPPAKANSPAQILSSNSPPSIARPEPLVRADSSAPILSSKSPSSIAKSKSLAKAGSPAPILLSGSPPSTAKRKPSAKADSPAPILQPSGKAASTYSNGRKRGPLLESEKPQQSKRARKTDPGPERGPMDNSWMQNSALISQQIVNAPSHGPTTDSRISEPLARVSEKVEENDEPFAVPWIQQRSRPARTSGMQTRHSGARASERPSKLTQTKAQTPRRHVVFDHPTRLTDDHLHRKVQIVGFSAKSPQNQGVSSSGKPEHGLEQSSFVPTETGKHLAFKNLHTDSRAVGKPAKAIPNPFQLLGGRLKRQVEFSFSDWESTDDGILVDEESAEDAVAAPAIADLENGKSASQPSKVDENGSPRLNLRETSRVSHQSNDTSVLEISGNLDENVDTTPVFESPESEGLESNKSAEFALKTAVSNYTAANAQMIAKMRNPRSRPSIGVGKLLDHSFPHAKESIETNAFKARILTDTTASTKAPGKSNSSNQFDHDLDPVQKVVSRGLPDEMISVDHDETTSFDIEQLNVSVADEQPSSAVSARVRRRLSSTPLSPDGEAPELTGSPLSFNTRLGKMIMPPPPKKETTRLDPSKKYELGLYMGREQSAMIDAETTLVNGEASEAGTNLSSPQRQQLSSSSSSGEEDDAPLSASQQIPTQAVNNDRRIWNQQVAQTQQTVKEILEQVSQKLFLRFSSAEQGIKSKLDHYHYGGWKILNNLVEQFDTRVAQEKETPSPRICAHRKRISDAINRLQRAKNSTRVGPSLDDLAKSRDKRSEYVLANLENFAAAQAP